MSNPIIVCVLGMHRSGTSVITRALNLCGVYLGPEEHLLRPAADNPKGFWEHQTFVALNDRILNRMGGGALEPPDFSSHWQTVPALKDLREAAQALINREFCGAPLWGWKDPRTCLTLPFWQQLLPRMRYVFCLRNPLDVAKSLQSRDGLSLARSIYLWFSYLRIPLIHTAGEQRLWICYEDLLSDCLRELDRIAHFLERPHLAERPEIREALHDFLDTGLQHHRSETGCSIGNGSPSAAARALHLSRQVHLALQQQPSPADGELLQQIDGGLNILRPDILKERHAEEVKWRQQLQAVTDHLSAVIPKGEKYIFVDEEQLGVSAPDRHPLPFLEKDGEYWGTPADDDTAIRELERLRHLGARSIVVAWPAFWWLEYYSGWHRYLRANYRCVFQNDRLIVFALR